MKLLLRFLALALVLALPANGQINTTCTASLLSTLTPCLNFLTNSSISVTSLSADCCGSFRNLIISNGMDCLCLIVTAHIPFQIPINPSLAISLPRACNISAVPVQCRGSVVPAPTPSSEAPDTTPMLTPPSPHVGSETPTETPDGGPGLIPSAAMATYTFSPFLLLFALGFVALKYY